MEEAPRRASLRQRGVQADGAAVDTEGRGGHITLVNGEAIRYPDPAEPAEPRERHPPSKHIPLVQATVYKSYLLYLLLTSSTGVDWVSDLLSAPAGLLSFHVIVCVSNVCIRSCWCQHLLAWMAVIASNSTKVAAYQHGSRFTYQQYQLLSDPVLVLFLAR